MVCWLHSEAVVLVSVVLPPVGPVYCFPSGDFLPSGKWDIGLLHFVRQFFVEVLPWAILP